MSPSDLIALVGVIATILFVLLMWQQNRLIRQQNIILAEGKPLPPLSTRGRLLSYWPMLTMGLLAVSIWIGLSLFYLKTKQIKQPSFVMSFDEWRNYKFAKIDGRRFSHETVVLDGKEFKDCIFDQVTFVYDGSLPFMFAGTSHYNAPTILRTGNARIFHYLALLAQLKILDPAIHTQVNGGDLMLGVPESDLGPAIMRRSTKPVK